MDYKTGKWASEIIGLQKSDGSWGNAFHTLSMPKSKQPMTTEQALRRLIRLGFTEDDAVIKKALLYMRDCLAKNKSLPDTLPRLCARVPVHAEADHRGSRSLPKMRSPGCGPGEKRSSR